MDCCLLHESVIHEKCIGADKPDTNKTGDAPQDAYGQEMHQTGTQDDIGTHQERSGELDGVEDGKQSYAHGDADMAVTKLGADDDILSADVGIIKRNKGIGHYHEDAAEPANFGDAEDRAVAGGHPFHKVIDGIIDAIGAYTDKGEVDYDGPVDLSVFADVIFLHFKYMQDLPEEEQADQDEPVVAVDFIIVAQCPQRASEEEQGNQGQEQVEPV